MTTHFVRPDVQMFLDFMNSNPRPDPRETPMPEWRAIMTAGRAMVDADDTPLAVVRDLTIPGPAGSIPARLYDPQASRAPGPVMVFFHGGGFVFGDLESHQSFCTYAAHVLDIPVIAVDYRLAPEHPFPAAPDDCEAAARWLASSPAELGFTVTGIVPCGDSAGGNLAITTAIALRDTPAAAPIVALFPYYPVVAHGGEWASARDFSEGFFLTGGLMKFFTAAYKAEPDSLKAYPMTADLKGLPPTVLTTAGLDPLRDQGRAFAGKLIEAGVPTTYREAVGNVHGFINFRKAVPSSHADVHESLSVLKAIIAEVSA